MELTVGDVVVLSGWRQRAYRHRLRAGTVASLSRREGGLVHVHWLMTGVTSIVYDHQLRLVRRAAERGIRHRSLKDKVMAR